MKLVIVLDVEGVDPARTDPHVFVEEMCLIGCELVGAEWEDNLNLLGLTYSNQGVKDGIA